MRFYHGLTEVEAKASAANLGAVAGGRGKTGKQIGHDAGRDTLAVISKCVST